MHDAIAARGPRWSQLGSMPLVMSFDDPRAEAERARTLALCDLSALNRVGVKGEGARAWLRECGADVPVKIYEVRALAPLGRIIRTGTTEFFIEDGPRSGWVARLGSDTPRPPAGVYRFVRQDASIGLVGESSFDVLAQTCGYNFREPEADFIYSRVAGVSCAILRDRETRPGAAADAPLFRIWCDASYGAYLWETLLEIVKECDGDAVGSGWLFPELSA
jgi:sarcosine oxidase subunit gamma